MADKGVTIVIKRVKKGGHGGAHGGAWKVAYADFVTAMMCFFLVMWLMGSDDETKAAISSYFNNPNPVSPWRPELKDNENIPLGNKTGSGDSILKGADVANQDVKDPTPVVGKDEKGKADEPGSLTEESISTADSIVFSIAEDELFTAPKTDILKEDKALKLLSVVKRIAQVFKGQLKIRGVLDSRKGDNFELGVSRLVAIQRFIVERKWMSEETVKTSFIKRTSESEPVEDEGPRKIELVFSR
jgi:flagellar motor protein MotB